MLFTYRCTCSHAADETERFGHFIEMDFPIGQAPAVVDDAHDGYTAARYYGPESMPQIGIDPFRQFDLSPRKESAQAEQKRYLDAPRDKVEAKALEQTTGRIYVGDDKSGMTKSAKRGIDRAKDSQRKIIVPVAPTPYRGK